LQFGHAVKLLAVVAGGGREEGEGAVVVRAGAAIVAESTAPQFSQISSAAVTA